MYLLLWFHLGESGTQKGLDSKSINKILELCETGPMYSPTYKSVPYFLKRQPIVSPLGEEK